MGQLKITLKRSPIGKPKKHKEIIRGLGLKRTQQWVIRKDTPEIWGMVNKIPHLVDVENVMDEAVND
ncbi:MAG: 50S ribosomal protein L30 [Nitrospirae bacterium CG_4_9_14_3_um_filter_53_35]|nr:MAG: 50S ribosomal protein L30 [Nitrospirae bacterium CG2_30_53_67]PIS37636.1 MAG: 50S ribosomal protein L30 [Nitrospirae bacterium CG08_land_8_20_14_0_20_52_24]PIV82597.1 MAG: 50S ribosomal protein L30 [Nitrospirae bacterium CG17_big_fil_post_rev_8_21_14_2_50_50_9]PIW86012.1 MAG: 50S ribosomal protein L30 [Nitrospirae bacterium CG_4_8_14_3_um_filter_50_41]PIX86884.1 MAG: 50S ribosomal protein L30 [Nitrospirae bacterium CG_4_10_14_3_um_filter_53_41]PJA76365.1 MAG: 50S ribosomal protein L30 